MKTERPHGEWKDNKFVIKCPICGQDSPKYSFWDGGFDAYYCKDCNEWIDEKCFDPECEFCKDRPEKPLYYGAEVIRKF